MLEKYYTAEEIEINKFYIKGTEKAYRLIERTGKEVEIYPNTISKIYKFEVINTTTGFKYLEDLALNPAFKCFSDLDKEEISEIIVDKKILIKNLEILVQ